MMDKDIRITKIKCSHLQGSLTEQIIRQRAIEKWDGKLPQYEMSGGSSAILNLK